MDPVSISAGVAGLMTLTFQVSGSLKAYIAAITDGPSNVIDMIRELEITHSSLEQLHFLIDSGKFHNARTNESSALDIALSTCHNVVIALRKWFNRMDSSMLSRLRWPFTEKEFQKHLETLRRCGSTFQFSLHLEG